MKQVLFILLFAMFSGLYLSAQVMTDAQVKSLIARENATAEKAFASSMSKSVRYLLCLSRSNKRLIKDFLSSFGQSLGTERLSFPKWFCLISRQHQYRASTRNKNYLGSRAPEALSIPLRGSQHLPY